MSTARTALPAARPQGSTAGEPGSATRVLAGTATIYRRSRPSASGLDPEAVHLVPGHADYVARAPGDLDVVDVGATHAELLREAFATEEVSLLETPAWPRLSEREIGTTRS